MPDEIQPMQAVPAGAQVVTIDQLAQIVEKHLQAVAEGLVVCNQGVPREVMWTAIATAMGRLLSAATRAPDIQTALATRENVCRIVTEAIKKTYPSFNPASVSMMPRPANGNGMLRQ